MISRKPLLTGVGGSPESQCQRAPESYHFLPPGEYLYAHSVLENVIFGYLRTDQAEVNERLRRVVVDLLEEVGLIDNVREIGLEFQVGSKGDRLSGGQKTFQKLIVQSPEVGVSMLEILVRRIIQMEEKLLQDQSVACLVQ